MSAKMPFEGDVGGNCPNFAESFSKRWLKRWRKKGRETRESARVSTGFFEVGIQTIDFLFLKFFIEGGVDAQRDRDVLMDPGQGTRCPPRWHRMQDSNLRQPVLETGAPPNRHMRLKNFVQFS